MSQLVITPKAKWLEDNFLNLKLRSIVLKKREKCKLREELSFLPGQQEAFTGSIESYSIHYQVLVEIGASRWI